MIAFLKKFWRQEVGIFLVIWLMLMIGGRSRFFRDPGTFWHTVVGRQMLSSHQLIYQDHACSLLRSVSIPGPNALSGATLR